MKYVYKTVAAVLAFMLAAPKAIGLTIMFYVDAMASQTRFAEGPGDMKELELSVKKAFETMQENIRKVQDTAVQALEEVKKEGTLHGETNKKLTELSETGAKLSENYKTLQDRMQEVEQKMTQRRAEPEQAKSLEQTIVESDQFKAAQARGAGATRMDPVTVGSFHKTQIVNATGQNQPLVPSQRVNGIIVPAQRRFTIRDLIPQARTTSNLIEYASESTFTSAAAPQGGGSPGNAEGELKAESAMTFTLTNAPVITLAHWIPASRQVLADAALLAGHISGRLTYGLKLEEENELLTGTGAAGTLNGLVNQATAFSYGVTNQTAIDTLLKAMLQVSLSNYEASGVILHPTDWTNIMLLKDTTGRYLFADPQNMVADRIWAKPVVSTASMTLGRFLVGAFDLAAQIWDREDATVRVSENVNDHFIRNLVAVLAEERLALTVYRTAALVGGVLSQAG